MDTKEVTLDRNEALKLYRAYKTHSRWSKPIDKEIQRTYQLIAQGKVVIKALESIKTAGLSAAEGLPVLAIARADSTHCRLSFGRDGSATFSPVFNNGMRQPQWRTIHKLEIQLPAGTFETRVNSTHGYRAVTPLIPLEHRPKRGIENYHILWEADWHAVPVDPMLLRRIGKGDLWMVVAAWDLTEVERTALAARVRV